MNRIFTLLLSFAVLLITTQRLPAPIAEEPTPAPAPRAKATAARTRSDESSGVSSLDRFNGTWKWSGSGTGKNGNFTQFTYLLVIRNGNSAVLTIDTTGTLGQNATWTNLPAPYNAQSPLHLRVTKRSSDLRPEGSNLRINWPAAEVNDWSPKSIPKNILLRNNTPASALYFFAEGKLMTSDGKTTHPYERVK